MKTSVYIHIPYCLAKCRYCDFLSFPQSATLPVADYLEALQDELALRGAELKAKHITVDTVYIGGGTPTALTTTQLETLLNACTLYLPLADAEWTVEVNPGTIDAEKAGVLAAHGVNRISLGIQATDDHRLAFLGRTHTVAQAKQAFFLCRRYFPSLSVDLMAGLPEQTVTEFLEGLREVCSWKPDHISVYGLKVEEGTELFQLLTQDKIVLPSEDEVLDMLLSGRGALLSSGYLHYEIANFARPGHLCRHNINYWQNQPYLGLGLGAHSFWDKQRVRNVTDFQQYKTLLEQGRIPLGEKIHVSKREEMEDAMMLGLRLLGGVEFAEFTDRYGIDARHVFAAEIAHLQSLDLVACDDDGIRLTLRGYPLANLVFAEFLTG